MFQRSPLFCHRMLPELGLAARVGWHLGERDIERLRGVQGGTS